jgi:hypothetical protein
VDYFTAGAKVAHSTRTNADSIKLKGSPFVEVAYRDGVEDNAGTLCNERLHRTLEHQYIATGIA